MTSRETMTSNSVCLPIYLDYAATSPLRPEVIARMHEVLQRPPGNSSARHPAGQSVHTLIEAARHEISQLVGASSGVDLIFTSGATEANNLAITGTITAALKTAPAAQVHVVTLATEHKSVLEPIRAVSRQGVQRTELKPDRDGLISAEQLEQALTPATKLVSLLHVNNETGVAQDIPALAAACAARGIPLHVDASQSAGKLPIDLQSAQWQGVSLLTLTAHKLGGPPGVGALAIRGSHRGYIEPVQRGGGHEQGMRAGTLAMHQIVAFAEACRLMREQGASEAKRVTLLRERLWRGLVDLPDVLLNGHATQRVPGILNVSFPGVEGESLFMALSDLSLSTGSACSSRSADPSFVLRALGRDTQTAQSSLRFSLGFNTTEAEIDAAISIVRREHQRLWQRSPARPIVFPHDEKASGQRDEKAAGENRVGEAWVGEAGALRLGLWLRFTVQAQQGRVARAHAQVYGCPTSFAVADLICERLRGQPLPQVAVGTPQEWLKAVNGPIEKLGAALIIEDALKALRQVP